MINMKTEALKKVVEQTKADGNSRVVAQRERDLELHLLERIADALDEANAREKGTFLDGATITSSG